MPNYGPEKTKNGISEFFVILKMFYRFILRVTRSKNNFKMFCAKTFAKILQNILPGYHTARLWLHVK